MFNRDWRAHNRAHPTAVSAVGMLGFATGESVAAASASVNAPVHDGTPQVMGTPGPDKLALGLTPGDPDTADLDVGDDGTVDFSLDRSTFAMIAVRVGAGDDARRVDESRGALTGAAVRLDGGPGKDILTGESGADVIGSDSGDDAVRGGDGDVVLDGGFGQDQVDGEPGEHNVLPGTGDDPSAGIPATDRRRRRRHWQRHPRVRRLHRQRTHWPIRRADPGAGASHPDRRQRARQRTFST